MQHASEFASVHHALATTREQLEVEQHARVSAQRELEAHRGAVGGAAGVEASAASREPAAAAASQLIDAIAETSRAKRAAAAADARSQALARRLAAVAASAAAVKNHFAASSPRSATAGGEMVGDAQHVAAPPIEVKHVMRALEHIVAASSGATEEITGGGIEHLTAQAGTSAANAESAERAHVAQMRDALATSQQHIEELTARVAEQSAEGTPARPGSAARWKSKARELAMALKMSRAVLRKRGLATPSSEGTAVLTPARAAALLATPVSSRGSTLADSESAQGSPSARASAADADALRVEITASVKAAYKLRFATKIVGAIEQVRKEERAAASAALDKQRAEWGLQVSSMQEAREATRVVEHGPGAGVSAGVGAGVGAADAAAADSGAGADANAAADEDGGTDGGATVVKTAVDAAAELEALTAHAITMFDSHRRRHEIRNCFRGWRHVLELKMHRRDAREQQHYLLLEKERRRAETAPLERQVAAMKRKEEVRLALSKWKTHMAFGEEKTDRRVTAVRRAESLEVAHRDAVMRRCGARRARAGSALRIASAFSATLPRAHTALFSTIHRPARDPSPPLPPPIAYSARFIRGIAPCMALRERTCAAWGAPSSAGSGAPLRRT